MRLISFNFTTQWIMVLSENRKNFKKYSQNLKRKLVHFACPKCSTAVLPKNFEDHCENIHGFDTKCGCVWCWGKISWISRKKSENSLHLLECFRKFILSYEISAALKNAASTKTATNSTTKAAAATAAVSKSNKCTFPRVINTDNLLCLGRQFFDHNSRYLQNSLPPEALDMFCVLPVDPHPVAYADKNLNLAASYLKKYLETRDTHDWLHIMVKAVAFESFLRAIKEDGGTTGFLPFSCWCDGGPYEKARHRQHRHMIAVAPKEHFERKVWDKVGITEDRPCKNYPSKGMKRIVSAMHLVNTMGYLSKRKSRCEFPLKKNKQQPLTDKHFYIFTTLPVQFRLPLAVLWDKGLGELMKQQLFQNISIESLIQYPLNRVHSQWRQKIDDFYALPRGLVLPVYSDLIPTTSNNNNTLEDSRHIYLLNGRKLHFELSTEPLDPESWLSKQIDGGNCFYDTVEEEYWIPRKDDQEKLNLVMPREYQIRELRIENSNLKRKHDELIQEIRELNHKIHDVYEGEIKRLKMDIDKISKECLKCTCCCSSNNNNNNNNNNNTVTATKNNHVTINNHFK